VQHLNINRKITAMAAGVLDPSSGRDALLVGAQTTLLAYDIRNNSDLFYKDVPDGVNAMRVGTINAYDAPLAVVGGNCSIQGFDHEGNEQFWTVAGDNVACLEFCDVDSDGRMEMLVGSDDFEIRIFRDEEIVSEVTETAAVVGLSALRGARYGYALGNGTIGVYDRSQRVWRVKSKHTVSAISGFDLDGDGEPELISGWTQGRLEVRSDRTGEVVYKDAFGQPIAAIVKADYRKDGNPTVIVCGAGGEVRAYLPAAPELNGNLMNTNVELEQLQALTQLKVTRGRRCARGLERFGGRVRSRGPRGCRGWLAAAAGAGRAPRGRPARCAPARPLAHPVRASASLRLRTRLLRCIRAARRAPAQAELQSELKDLQANLKAGAAGDSQAGVIPSSTRVTLALEVSRSERCVYLVASASTAEVRVRAVCVFADQIFEGESMVAHDSSSSRVVRLALAPAKDVAAALAVQALVGGRGSSAYNVFELSAHLPKFAMYGLATLDDGAEPKSVVRVNVQAREGQVLAWAAQAFCPGVAPEQAAAGPFTALYLVSLRTGERLSLALDGGVLSIRTADMEVAGELIQDLCAFVQIGELEADADFPAEMAAFREVLQRVDELNATRLKLTAEMADASNMIKQLVIRAEDARLLGELATMRKTYTQLNALNQELIGEYHKRTNNQELLLEARAHPRARADRLRPARARARRVRGALTRDRLAARRTPSPPCAAGTQGGECHDPKSRQAARRPGKGTDRGRVPQSD
jgi:uncharacterized membrane-anchored protein YhcB (DUF1043 family)